MVAFEYETVSTSILQLMYHDSLILLSMLDF